MMPYGLYIASVLAALALYMTAPRRGYSPARLGMLLGAMTLGGLWIALAKHLPDLAGQWTPLVYYYLFSVIAIGSAVRVITHRRPVLSALWFVLVVLATAGLFVVLSATFVAFAMVIIYAGAIVVTYVFVIMLASPAAPDAVGDDSPTYDRAAREPAAAIAVGFLMLAVLLTVAFEPLVANPRAAGPSDQRVLSRDLTQRPPELTPEGPPEVGKQAASVDNIERVGLDLFRGHPLGLELAGVILTVSLIGAVVLVRRPIAPEAAESPRDTDVRDE